MTDSSSSSRRYNDILGTSVTRDDLDIPVNKLPTKMQVLRAYLAEFSVKLANMEVPDKRQAAQNVKAKVSEIYERAHIPTLKDSSFTYHIDKLYQSYR